MKIIFQIVITALFVCLLQSFMPWWGIGVIAGIVALLLQKNLWKSFVAGFLAVFLCWSATIYKLDQINAGVVSNAIGEIFKINGTGLILLSSFLGALLAGFFAVTGSCLKQLISK